MAVNPEVQYRYFIKPEQQLLPVYDLLQFGPEYTTPLVQKGKDDAKRVIEMGEGKSFESLFWIKSYVK